MEDRDSILTQLSQLKYITKELVKHGFGQIGGVLLTVYKQLRQKLLDIFQSYQNQEIIIEELFNFYILCLNNIYKSIAGDVSQLVELCLEMFKQNYFSIYIFFIENVVIQMTDQ